MATPTEPEAAKATKAAAGPVDDEAVAAPVAVAPPADPVEADSAVVDFSPLGPRAPALLAGTPYKFTGERRAIAPSRSPRVGAPAPDRTGRPGPHRPP